MELKYPGSSIFTSNHYTNYCLLRWRVEAGNEKVRKARFKWLVWRGMEWGRLADGSIMCCCPHWLLWGVVLGCWHGVKGSDGVDRVS